MSSTLRLSPYSSTIVLTTGPRLSVSSVVTRLRPTNATPTVRPDFSDLKNPLPTHTPMIVKMIGIMTEAPSPSIQLMTSMQRRL